jgi:ABC-type antimicrobial peptide transport system, ATPase component
MAQGKTVRARQASEGITPPLRVVDPGRSFAPVAMRVRNLSKTYHGGQRSVVALDDIDFQIGEGEFISIVGQEQNP